MKKIFSLLFLILAVLVGNAQTQPMKFLGIGMNSTMSTFVSKLKGKGFVEDVSHTKPNYTVMKGTFAGERVKLEIGRVIVGQDELVSRLLLALLCNNHVLIEGVPGLAKTLTVTSLAQCLQASFHRIQFTPDLLPADVRQHVQTGRSVHGVGDAESCRAGRHVCAAGGAGGPFHVQTESRLSDEIG